MNRGMLLSIATIAFMYHHWISAGEQCCFRVFYQSSSQIKCIQSSRTNTLILNDTSTRMLHFKISDKLINIRPCTGKLSDILDFKDNLVYCTISKFNRKYCLTCDILILSR